MRQELGAAQFVSLGYDPSAAQGFAQRANGSIAEAGDVIRVIEAFAYYTLPPGGRSDRSVSDAVVAGNVTCLEAALIAHDLMSFLACPRRLMVMNRLDPATRSYLGHTALVYRAPSRSYGAIAVSRHRAQRQRPPKYASEEGVVLSYAEAYVELGMVPLGYGMADLEIVAEGLDWRRHRGDMERLHDRLLEAQVNHFEIHAAS